MAATSTVLSETERQFIFGGVEDDIRSDGRGCRHVRHFILKKGVVSNTSGSAMIERVCHGCIVVSCQHDLSPISYLPSLVHVGKDECHYRNKGRAWSAAPFKP